MKTNKMITKMFTTFLVIFTFNLTQAQNTTGTLKGKITDQGNNNPLPFANVVLLQEGKQVTGTMSDLDGRYAFKNIQPGKYDLNVTFVSYQAKKVKNIQVIAGTVKIVDVQLKVEGQSLAEYEVVKYSVPLTQQDAASGQPVIRSEIKAMPGRTYRRYKKSKNYNFAHAPQDNFNTEGYAFINENDFKNAKSTPLSTFSIDVDAASYSNMRRFITKGQNPPVDAVRIEEMINYFNYDYPTPRGEHPFSITTEMSDCPWNRKHKLIHIGLQGEKIATDNLPASNLVFLLDVSGSMNSPNKLPLLKKSFGLLVDQLTAKDRVAIVVYAGAAGLVLASTPGNQKEKILNALNQLSAGGSTAGGQGIKLAYTIALQNFIKEGNNRVILATDGDFNVGASSDGEMTRLIEQKRASGVFLTCLGFGMGNYKDSKMETLADKGNGNYAYIDNILEAKKVLVTEMGGTMHTIAKDVKLQLEFNPEKIASYKLIGYENRLLNDEDFNDDTKDAGELGSGHTVTALYEVVLKGSEDAPSVDPLRYQKNTPSDKKQYSDELLTVKFRYKKPKESKSKLITKHLTDRSVSLSEASENFRFSAAVAQFGLLLRNSKHKAEASYDNVLKLAKSSKGKDENGYRSEFIRLVEMSELQVSDLH